MLERVECKVWLILLSVLSLLALASTIAAVVLSVIWSYVGFMMSSATYSFICSSYLTLKLHYNIIFNFNAIFVGGSASLVFQIFVFIHLVYLLVKYCKSEERYFQELTQSIFARLYIGYSLSLLGVIISTGYYITYIVQQGWNCLNYIYGNWLILGAIFGGAFLFLLVCWICLLIFWIRNKKKFEELKEQTVNQSSAVADEPQNMIGFFQAMKEVLKKQANHETNKPLLQQPIDQEDHPSQMEAEKQKLELMSYQDYKKKEEQKQLKAKQQLDLLKKLFQQQQQRILRQEHQKLAVKMQAQRIKKQKFSDVALSPDDPDFNEIFMESEQEVEQKKEHKQVKQEPQQEYFPPNFVPQNPKQAALFQQYKKKLLRKFNHNQRRHQNPNPNSPSITNEKPPLYIQRHPQNIGAGRSKKVLQRFIKANKKPLRDESIYLRANFQNSRDGILSTPMIQIDEQDQISAQFNQNVPEILMQTPQQASKIQENHKNNSNDVSKQQQPPQVLFFHKSKTKSQSRKKLFEEEQKFITNQAFSSVLSSLVKGVQEASFKSKLKQLRQKRDENQNVPKSKRSQKLLDSIRSKFC